jgi:hypothetical protein
MYREMLRAKFTNGAVGGEHAWMPMQLQVKDNR